MLLYVGLMDSIYVFNWQINCTYSHPTWALSYQICDFHFQLNCSTKVSFFLIFQNFASIISAESIYWKPNISERSHDFSESRILKVAKFLMRYTIQSLFCKPESTWINNKNNNNGMCYKHKTTYILV